MITISGFHIIIILTLGDGFLLAGHGRRLDIDLHPVDNGGSGTKKLDSLITKKPIYP